MTKEEQKRRKMQSKKDKASLTTVTKFKVDQGQKRGKLLNRKELKVSWIESVLAPFKFDAQRGPSDFLQPTAIFTGKNIFELQSPSNACLYMIIHPHFHNGQIPWVGQNVDMVNVWTGVTVLPTIGSGGNQLTLPGTSATSLLSGFGSQSTTVTTARFLSYRVTQFGIRIIPDGANLNKQGNITFCMIPGKTFTVPGTYGSATGYPLPSAQTLRQYPSSYEVSVATLGPEGAQFVWLPLDPMDYIFLGGAPNLNSQPSYVSLDDAMLSNYYRNPIHILFDGIATTDKFRIVIKYGVEYVPTGQFEPFIENRLSDTNDDVRKELKQQVKQAGVLEAVSGGLGNKISNFISDYGFLAGPYRPYVDLAGQALNKIF